MMLMVKVNGQSVLMLSVLNFQLGIFLAFLQLLVI